jgi:hypothetical protein
VIEVSYIRFRPRPKKDGIHDSGYRFIELTGVTHDGTEYPLGSWHDHFLLEPGCNIDVTPEGEIRIMPALGKTRFLINPEQKIFTSSAWIHPDGFFM